MNQKKVWFVVVAYKPDNEALRSLIAAIHEWPMEIVDNTEKNLGYGGGANVGMKRAFDAGAQWVIVLNQDVKLTKKGITKFCNTLQKSEPGVVGPEVGSLDPKRWTTILASERSLDSLRSLGMTRNVYISGALMAIHRNVWEATGGFYEPYVMYYEDADICRRAKKVGFELRQTEIDGFRHESHESKQKEYYLARNHLLFVWRLAPISVKFYELIRLPKTIWETLW